MRMLNSDGEMQQNRHSVQNSNDKNLRVVSREERERLERYRHTAFKQKEESKILGKPEKEDGND